MLWFCHYRANDGVKNKELLDRFGQPDDGENFEMFKGIRAWYAFAGLNEGVVVIDIETPFELTGILQPCRHLVTWEVHAVQEMEMDPDMALLR
jgi:hypothetical protein